MSDADGALLPCPVPWCESEVIEVVYSPWSRGYYAACQSCRCQGPSLATHAEAIAAWNRRAPDDRDATIARLREAIELVWRKAATMRNANKLVGPYPNYPAKTKLWAKALYHEGKDLQKMLQPYRAALETGK